MMNSQIAFARMFIFPGEPGEQPLLEQLAHPDVHLVPELSKLFHDSLISSPSAVRVMLTAPDGAETSMLWIASGQTAGIALWTRDQKVLAISLLMSGLDRQEDLESVVMASAVRQMPLVPQMLQRITELCPPMLINVLGNRDVTNDFVVLTASLSLATALFGMLGVGQEQEGELPLPDI